MIIFSIPILWELKTMFDEVGNPVLTNGCCVLQAIDWPYLQDWKGETEMREKLARYILNKRLLLGFRNFSQFGQDITL